MVRKNGAALLALVILLAAVILRRSSDEPEPPQAVQPGATTQSPDSRQDPDAQFRMLAAKVEPSVVNINTVWPDTKSDSGSRVLSGDIGFFTFFDYARQRGRSSLGSGFIVSSAGHILTQSRIVSDASRLSVRLPDGRLLPATLIGADPAGDIAVLKIPADGLPSLKLTSSENISVGEWVAAFGRPLGAGGIMRAGIICAKTSLGESGLLQTDALIDGSNTGGPLVNIRGEVVGVSAARTADPLFNGPGYAIPAARATRIYEHLIRSGSRTRGWLGLRVRKMGPKPEDRGVVIISVYPRGPGARAGLMPGDVITEFDGNPVRSAGDLSVMTAGTQVGSSVTLGVLRGDQKSYRKVSVGERQASVSEVLQSKSPERLGITIQDIPIHSDIPISYSGRIIVIDVEPGSRAEYAGVQPGDIILEANRRRLAGASDLIDIISSMGQGDNVLLKIARSGLTVYLVL